MLEYFTRTFFNNKSCRGLYAIQPRCFCMLAVLADDQNSKDWVFVSLGRIAWSKLWMGVLFLQVYYYYYFRYIIKNCSKKKQKARKNKKQNLGIPKLNLRMKIRYANASKDASQKIRAMDAKNVKVVWGVF